MRIDADMRPITIVERPGGPARFRPIGRIRVISSEAAKEVPRRWYGDARTERKGARLLAARFLVGFNVDGKPRWTEDDLIELFVKIRQKQGRSAGATFIAQRGIWQPVGGLRQPDERGAQIVVLNDDGIDKVTFIEEMSAMGEELARRMKQDAIYLDIQNAGRVIRALVLTGD